MNKQIKLIISALSIFCGNQMIHAAENGSFSYSAGASNFAIAQYPPAVGNYLQMNTVYTTSSQLNDAKGNEIKGKNFDLDAISQSFRLVTTWDKKFLNADIMASELIMSYAHSDTSFDTAYGRYKKSKDGVGDISILPFTFQWNLGEQKNWQTAASVVYVVPSGSKISKNRYSIQPTAGFKYHAPSGFEFGLLPRVSFNWENSDTKYKTGTELFVDYLVGYRKDNFSIGLTGYYATQFENDELRGIKIPDSKTEGFSIGPGIRYAYNKKYFINVNWQTDLMAKNKSKNDTVYFTVAFPY